MAAPLFAMPEVIASGIGVIGSLGSSLLSGLFNSNAMENQVEKQKELMDYEWDKYKSPSAQVNALAAAGINPSVALGQGGSGFSPTPNAGMPTSVPPVFGGLGEVADFVKSIVEAKKAGLDSVGKELENEFLTKTMDERIRQIGLQNKFTEEQTTKVIQEWNKITGEINVLRNDADIKKIDLDKHEELVNSIINHYVSQKNLNDEQANSIREQLPEILNKLKSESKILEVDAQIASDFKSTMSGLGVVGSGLKIIGQLLKFLK